MVSCEVPGLMPAVSWKGTILIDGALHNDLPLQPVRKGCVDLAIAVDMAEEDP